MAAVIPWYPTARHANHGALQRVGTREHGPGSSRDSARQPNPARPVRRPDRHHRRRQAGPGVAESWKQTNPTTWVFKLRANAKFSNGAPSPQTICIQLSPLVDPKTASPYANTFGVFLLNGLEVAQGKAHQRTGCEGAGQVHAGDQDARSRGVHAGTHDQHAVRARAQGHGREIWQGLGQAPPTWWVTAPMCSKTGKSTTASSLRRIPSTGTQPLRC